MIYFIIGIALIFAIPVWIVFFDNSEWPEDMDRDIALPRRKKNEFRKL